MSLIERKIESLPFVQTELNYLAPTDGKPRTYALDPPPGLLGGVIGMAPWTNFKVAPVALGAAAETV